MQGKSRKSNVTFRILNMFLDRHHRFRLNDKTSKIISPRPGIEPGPSTWQAEILTTRLSRIINRWEYVYNNVIGVEETMKSVIFQWQHNTYCSNAGVLYIFRRRGANSHPPQPMPAQYQPGKIGILNHMTSIQNVTAQPVDDDHNVYRSRKSIQKLLQKSIFHDSRAGYWV